ncbi:exopolysaccharide biosynthesis polyprenyl glycosylphosphotransferase [Streptomyces sp. MST-110588]|uniref:exopolysaccharide biosynthesis polyprenyl glycosylphosphotransferase n=1 Tax=Streptomyces sp. MST-110588 TaxID=2833628 RepID=UPI001F5C3B5D|nr:exopolysaccharide biosynthesis polyprenyl glycosylphosphotransferase [Streptomyces sp. MST-110588]UNO43233.1 exopolysaccharide biosynthesis polyprenyl glycosylphosphotransferase [Streptomyces sp. MST-110588]
MSTESTQDVSQSTQEMSPSAQVLPRPGPGPATAAVTASSPLSPSWIAAARTSVTARRTYRDAALLCGADVLATAGVAVALSHLTDLLPTLSAAGAVVAFHARAGLYRPGLQAYALDELPAVGGRVTLAWCVAATLLAVLGAAHFLGVGLLLAIVVSNTALVCAARGAVYAARRRACRRRPRSTLIIGSDSTAHKIAAVLTDRPRYGLRPVGLVNLDGDQPQPPEDGETNPAPIPVVGSIEDVTRAVIQNTVQDAVFLRPLNEEPQGAALARLMTERGVTGWLVTAGCLLEAHSRRHQDNGHLWGFACRRMELSCPKPGGTWGKRLLDLVLVLPALLVAAPLMAGCALAVRISDGPGVLFRQERIGQDGRPFTLLKFRTLRPDDERESGTLWSIAGDRRVSRVGTVLRRASLDELPQLWNVLRGDMSLVGPRPERPYFVQQFTQRHPGYADRHRAPVGITGFAQVHGLRGDTSIEDRARFDNHYIETWSLWRDVRIMCRTVAALFRLEGR